MFKKNYLIAALTLTGTAFAQDGICSAQAAEKKLAGAAKAPFMKKCVNDAAGG